MDGIKRHPNRIEDEIQSQPDDNPQGIRIHHIERLV